MKGRANLNKGQLDEALKVENLYCIYYIMYYMKVENPV